MPLNWRMDKENVVQLHNGVLLCTIKNNDLMKFADKWMEQEKIVLSEVTKHSVLRSGCED